ncbi:hypothetical protein F5Y01DRAFT_267226 [Xylaria sp. FL0043]|nr:hypothetical protein F5Y01DRAFT_267226 [Xylaria sp. FL0043]
MISRPSFVIVLPPRAIQLIHIIAASLSLSPTISSCRAKKFTACTVMVRKRLVTHSTLYHDAMASDRCVGRCAGDAHHCTWVEHWGRQGTSRARGPGQLDPDSHDARGRRG